MFVLHELCIYGGSQSLYDSIMMGYKVKKDWYHSYQLTLMVDIMLGQ